jgi:hypothetical protein
MPVIHYYAKQGKVAEVGETELPVLVSLMKPTLC